MGQLLGYSGFEQNISNYLPRPEESKLNTIAGQWLVYYGKADLWNATDLVMHIPWVCVISAFSQLFYYNERFAPSLRSDTQIKEFKYCFMNW